ncbi:unnamed protein product [Mycetohabitans rhizoxinica HKI 454]|uniref:Uncharacterized protein n=1 Tax=Mycetohabitans rhizoxinica (strain DSM 19002 / CIP 109453 / HKI 454) TaxID=882378 RepID=E5ART4_MYCRK|nr:unnamed protein product [Mycetohabitans rhizoxinica HKI 454]
MPASERLSALHADISIAEQARGDMIRIHFLKSVNML